MKFFTKQWYYRVQNGDPPPHDPVCEYKRCIQDYDASTMNIVRQNIIFSLGVKAVILSLGAVGITNMWFAIFADVGVSIIAILNALRALRIKTN